MRKDTKKALDHILDTFSGADGGINFVKFLAMLEDIDKQAENGDEASQKILMVIWRFEKLVAMSETSIDF